MRMATSLNPTLSLNHRGISAVMDTSRRHTNDLWEKIIRQPHRSRYELIDDILEQVVVISSTKNGKCRPLYIGYSCGMAWGQQKKYLNLLTTEGLLISSKSGPFQYYEITDKGLRYLSYSLE
jgi:predicted transcriptional regulator